MSADCQDPAVSRRDKAEIAVLTGLSAIPYVGGPAAQAYSTYTTAKQFARMKAFMDGLKAHVASLAAEVDLRHVRFSERQEQELPQLVEEVRERVERETREAKTAWLQAFMAGALLDAECWDLSKRLFFLSVLDGLSPAELFLLVTIDRYGLRFSAPDGDPPYDAQKETVLTRFDGVQLRLPFSVEWTGTYLERLARAGLLRGIVQKDVPSGQLPQPIHQSWHMTQDVGRGFLRCFAFPGGEPTSGPPWDDLALQ